MGGQVGQGYHKIQPSSQAACSVVDRTSHSVPIDHSVGRGQWMLGACSQFGISCISPINALTILTGFLVTLHGLTVYRVGKKPSVKQTWPSIASYIVGVSG